MLEYYRRPAFYYSSSIEKPSSVEEGENHRAYRNWQINQPLFESTERRKNEMTEQDKEYFKTKAQKQLKFWGYENSDGW